MGSSRARNSTRAAKARSVKSRPEGRRKPFATRKRSDPGARPEPAPPAEGSERLVPATALQAIQDKLEIARSCAAVVAHALEEQNCELDGDAALTLRHHVAEAITDQVIEIGLLIHGEAS
jgi:hypothetical protein